MPTEPSSVSGGIGPYRRWTTASASLADLKAIGHHFGGTVNDVILATVAGGLRALLLERGEPVERIRVRTLVPVSVRTASERGSFNNRVSAMFAELPLALADPEERLGAVVREMHRLKESHEALVAERLTVLGGITPSLTVVAAEQAVMRAARRLPQHSVNLITTNVPGPDHPLYLVGHRLVEYLPFVPIICGARLGVAVVSYDGRVAFGITGDYDTTVDIGRLARAIGVEVEELLARSRPGTDGAPPGTPASGVPA